MKAVLAKIIELGRARSDEGEAIAERYLDGRGVSFPGGSKDAAYHAAPRPKEEALRSFLEALSIEELQLCTAIMYCGRDRDPDIAGMQKSVKANLTTKALVVAKLMEKTPLANYLTKGIALVGVP